MCRWVFQRNIRKNIHLTFGAELWQVFWGAGEEKESETFYGFPQGEIGKGVTLVENQYIANRVNNCRETWNVKM